MKNMNWDDIRYFLALSRASTFIGAGTELKVTHSTVSRRITNLEESLDTRLFHRSEKGCRLTPAGEKLLPYAESLESTYINIEEHVSGSNSQLSGSVRIGAPDGIGNCFLAPRLTVFQQDHPSLQIELTAEPMYYSLSKREIDILVTVQKPTVGNVLVRKLTRYKLGLFATPEYLSSAGPVSTKEDLKGHRMIGYIDELLFDHELHFMDEILPGLSTNFRCSTVVAQLNATLSGAGIGVIPFFMVHGQKRLIQILPELTIERGYWLKLNPESKRLARVRSTIDFLVGQIVTDEDLFLSPPQDVGSE
ncbi:LysR family transcriptional regulator [Desulfopila sp. IMCC35008]|uniref:LysR family transcriptional regulator n=1 Tax=Desulfopila sp. IMCC35008 TaxID=2653858 RepID=UPI0013CF5F0D|nr:LysR family transcriptional regulator [Desulfopila sp. IMCC35008]